VIDHAQRIREIGYTVLPGALTLGEAADLRMRLDRIMEQQVAEAGGAEALALLDDANIARCPLAHDSAFARLPLWPPLVALCRDLLGEHVLLLQQNGIIVPRHAAHSQAAYHRDLPYQEFVSSHPLAITALLCLDPFTAETGSTIVIPGSHRADAFPPERAADATAVVAGAGDFVVFDAMLFHRAGENRAIARRRAVNHVVGRPFLAQQICLPTALQGRYADDAALARLLGYDTGPARSVADWRARRARRLTAHRP
jgi:ectoine hydroxylase-related dioxygenase (phytanoyl-CoA dioxygenase family)